MNGVDHYRTLGVAPTASREEIRRAYLALARRYHPDSVDHLGGSGGDPDRMAAVNDAWRVLGDTEERADYDRRTRLQRARDRPPPPPPRGPVPGWEVVDPDEPAPDTIEGTPVQLALRVLPWVVIALVIVGIFVFTAFAGPDSGPATRRIGRGVCVLSDDGIVVVDCARTNDGRVAEIVSAGVECPDPDMRTLPRPDGPGALCLETTLNTRNRPSG